MGLGYKILSSSTQIISSISFNIIAFLALSRIRAAIDSDARTTEMSHRSRTENSAVHVRLFFFFYYYFVLPSSRRKLGDVLQAVYGQAAARRLPGGSAARCINCLYISIHPPGR